MAAVSKPHASARILLVALLLTASPPANRAHAADERPAPSPDELLIDGIVVNQLGTGLSGAEVRIESPDAPASAAPLAQTVTGSRGEIRLQLKRPPGDELRYRISLEGFTAQVGTLDISDPDEPPFIDVTLQGAATLAGTVIQAKDNKPVADARIQCQNGGRTLTTRTGPDGSYTFASIYFEPAVVTVLAPGYGTQRGQVAVEDENVTLDFTLSPERPIQLTVVTNTDRPAADILIEAIVEPLQVQLSARTDATGRAALTGVGLDSTGLSIRLNGDSCLTMRGYDEYLELPPLPETDVAATTQPAKVEARFVVTLAGRIRGKVTDRRTGEPVHNVRIIAGGEPRYDMPMDWSGPEGLYELVGVAPGVVTVTFQHKEYATAFQTVDLDTGKVSTLDVALETGVPIAGLVRDEQGQPLSQVRVSADQLGQFRTLGLRAITDEQGRFACSQLPPTAKEIELTFLRPGYGGPEKFVLDAGRTDHVVTLMNVTSQPASGPAPMEQDRLKPGQEVPDLQLTALDGKTYKLSELRGRYVFLDCWASWCRPCLAEIPNVKKLFEATRDRADFILIGISLDTDAKALKRACEDHGMSWPQIFGPRSGASEAFEELDGVGIPYTCLIGPDGKLIEQHLRGPQMAQQVLEHLPAKDAIPADAR